LGFTQTVERRWSQTATHQINNIYETGEWPKDFSEVTVIVLTKKPRAIK
jgi:hypothetical protein